MGNPWMPKEKLNELEDIRRCKIIERVLHKQRMSVIIEPPYRGQRRMPMAHYNWLSTNLAFKEIPKGYVLHHLDYNELNDDPSNLALMSKTQHTAHHWKYKNIDAPVKYNGSVEGKPLPLYVEAIKIIDRGTDPERYMLSWYNKKSWGGGGEQVRLCSYNGKVFETEDDANNAITQLQKDYNIPFRNHP